MYVVKLQLKLIESVESLTGHLPYPIASRLELLAKSWRTKVQLDMLGQIERMKKDLDLLRKEASEIQSITRKMNDSQSSNRADKD
jgi:hypothetical protein